MKRPAAAFVAGTCVAALLSAPPAALSAPTGSRGSIALPTSLRRPPIVRRELVVRFRRGAERRSVRALHAATGARVTARAASFGIDVVHVPRGRPVGGVMRAYRRDPRVISVERNVRRFPTVVPPDPLFRHQWEWRNTGQGHRAAFGGSHSGRNDADVDATEAWDVETGDPGTVVAVLDSGVDLDHPDLQAAIWTNPGETPGNDLDDDGNGFVDDVHGWDFKAHDANPNPPRRDPHGTHVAGVIAAQHDAYGVAGLCPDCRIMPLRFGLTIAQEVRAIEYAVENGADVINMSFGGPVWSAAERAAIAAAGDAGVLVVASAGNNSLDNDVSAFMSNNDSSPSYPASYDLPTILSVAASTDRDVYGYSSLCDRRGAPEWVCAFTSWGRVSVDVAAPGTDIMSTVIEGTGPRGTDHEVWDGTSMAAPHVSAIAGLVLSREPTLAPLEVKNAIMNGVNDPSSLRLASYHRRELGLPGGLLRGRFTRTQGRVNAVGALALDTSNATRRTDGTIRGARRLRRVARGHVGWPADANDVFAKQLDASTRYRVTLRGAGPSDLDLYVWNPRTVDIWQFDAGCFHIKGRCAALRAASSKPRADEAVTFRTGKAGTYFIHVNSWFSASPYRLRVSRT